MDCNMSLCNMNPEKLLVSYRVYIYGFLRSSFAQKTQRKKTLKIHIRKLHN